ncbi:hypothetical protein [Bradyrhizobium valentinum]|uniref:hypothetical protein n=1 Tax=Bradyrhizobium valentinum TaxID=1518501 RepID=UPI000A88A7DE|nr:hypothetical protein [Bradyrhizobium valentinum]
MQLLNDIHHLTFITANMNRLICFYERIFGARVTVDLEEEATPSSKWVRTLSCTHFRSLELNLLATSPCSSAGVSTTLRSMPQARRRSGKYGGASLPRA